VHPDFRELFEREFDAMVSLARLVANDRGEVEDIVMDAFLETGRRFESLASPGGYLRTSVINGARRRYRNATTRKAIRDRFAVSIARLEIPDVNENYLDDVLDKLSEPEHTTIVLIYYLGATYAEAADVMNCPIGTVKSHAHRALRSLRRQVLQ